LGPELAFIKHYWNSQFSISTLFAFFMSTDAADFPLRKSGRAENLQFSDMPPWLAIRLPDGFCCLSHFAIGNAAGPVRDRNRRLGRVVGIAASRAAKRPLAP